MDSILGAQKDMRESYFNGVPGVVASGSAWLIAGVVALLVAPLAGVFTLVFGGTLIFPVSVLLCKLLGCSGKHNKNNPLAPLAIEGTFWMLLSIPVAGGAAFYRLEWFFPAMMLVIAGRYLTFSTLYGLRTYWFFALALVVFAFLLLGANAPVFIGGLAGGLIEVVFAVVIFIVCKQSGSATSSSPGQS